MIILCFDTLIAGHIQNWHKFRPMLSMADAEMIVYAFVTSRLDYCNAQILYIFFIVFFIYELYFSSFLYLSLDFIKFFLVYLMHQYTKVNSLYVKTYLAIYGVRSLSKRRVHDSNIRIRNVKLLCVNKNVVHKIPLRNCLG